MRPDVTIAWELMLIFRPPRHTFNFKIKANLTFMWTIISGAIGTELQKYLLSAVCTVSIYSYVLEYYIILPPKID